MNYWIFKVGDQDKYADSIGEKYTYDNTHSIKLAEGDSFIYLSTQKNRYEFIGFGKVVKLERREPRGKEKRNDRVRIIYVATLGNISWFAEPLDFSSQKGRLNRVAVGMDDALSWGISMPRINEELYTKIIQLAQPGQIGMGNSSWGNLPRGVPTKDWIEPQSTTERFLLNENKNNNTFERTNFDDARDKTLRSLCVRRGQPKFRKELIEAYGGKCAITGCDVVNALQAAHIYPYRGHETNKVNNGLLLRSDIHDLFDLGLITFDTSSMTVILHETLLDSSYATLHGMSLKLPEKEELRPNKVYLDWHRAWWHTRPIRPGYEL